MRRNATCGLLEDFLDAGHLRLIFAIEDNAAIGSTFDQIRQGVAAFFPEAAGLVFKFLGTGDIQMNAVRIGGKAADFKAGQSLQGLIDCRPREHPARVVEAAQEDFRDFGNLGRLFEHHNRLRRQDIDK